MKPKVISFTAICALMLGCGASRPVPAQQLADVQSATRSASELGAAREPRAQLHLKLAEEQMAQAKSAIRKEDNENAERLLIRAKSDAELAVALMHESNAKLTASTADQQSDSQRSVNASQGAKP